MINDEWLSVSMSSLVGQWISGGEIDRESERGREILSLDNLLYKSLQLCHPQLFDPTEYDCAHLIFLCIRLRAVPK